MSSYDFQLIYDSFFGGVAIVNNLFATGVLVLTLVARGFMFNKANEPAWQQLCHSTICMSSIKSQAKLNCLRHIWSAIF